jgi:hypothetical protein
MQVLQIGDVLNGDGDDKRRLIQGDDVQGKTAW